MFGVLSVLMRHLHARRVQRSFDTERQVIQPTDKPLVKKIIHPYGIGDSPAPQELNGD